MINIYFDRRVELIYGLLYCVSRDYEISLSQCYKNTIPSYCEEFYKLYKENISSELIDYIISNGLDFYDRTLHIAMSFDNEYNIVSNSYIDSISKSNSNFNASLLSKLIKDFVYSSNYNNFFINHYEFYNNIIYNYKLALNKYVKFDENILVDFFGYRKGDFNIILYNFSNGNFGYYENDGIFCVCCVNNKGIDEEHLEFSPNTINMCFHEFSHPYVNPLGYEYFSSKDIPESFINEAKDNGLFDCYVDSVTLINEYVVRAIQTYFTKKYMGNSQYDRVVSNHKVCGYIYIEDLVKLLDNREKYDNFSEFYKALIVKYFMNVFN